VYEEVFSGTDGKDQRDLHGVARTIVGLAKRESASVVDTQDGHLDGDIAAGDAVGGSAGDVSAHSITLAFSSSSSFS
jgi:hypothetical protein